MRFAVALYETDRAYGGPEEGGWWYDTASFRRLLALAATADAAEAAVRRANRLLDRLQRHARGVDSMAYDGGRHRAMAFDGLPPDALPEQRPVYS